MHFELKDALELLSIGGMILAATWTLSAQISRLEAKSNQNATEIDNVWNVLDIIAPRQVQMNRERQVPMQAEK